MCVIGSVSPATCTDVSEGLSSAGSGDVHVPQFINEDDAAPSDAFEGKEELLATDGKVMESVIGESSYCFTQQAKIDSKFPGLLSMK